MGRATMRQERFREERAFMLDFWEFRKTFYDWSGQPDDEFWQSLYDAVRALEGKYREQYYVDMMVACVSDIERRCREAKKKPAAGRKDGGT